MIIRPLEVSLGYALSIKCPQMVLIPYFFSLSPLSCALSNAIPSLSATQPAKATLHLTPCFSLWAAFRTDKAAGAGQRSTAIWRESRGSSWMAFLRAPMVAREMG